MSFGAKEFWYEINNTVSGPNFRSKTVMSRKKQSKNVITLFGKNDSFLNVVKIRFEFYFTGGKFFYRSLNYSRATFFSFTRYFIILVILRGGSREL